MSATAAERLIIFDTTLRDGEQSPGASMNLAEKLELARALKDLGVDVIEAGFPIASPGDFESVQTIARQVEGPIIAGLARCNPADIDRAGEAVKDAARPRIHVFLATSAIHREFKLRMAKEEIVRRAIEAVKRAKDLCEDVEFSPEDASRTELDFLAEVFMAMRTRGDFFNIQTGINTRRLYHTSRLVSHVTGIHVPRNKAVVGQNAFAHESGIHQDGMLKERSTYEIMDPEDVGLPKTELVLGKHSGRHALRQRVRELGYHLDEGKFQKVFEAFKLLADRKKLIYDADIEALAEAQIHDGPALWTLEAFQASAGGIPTATVCLWHKEGIIYKDAAVGDGPVDAIFKTIERITGIEVTVRDYRVRSVTVGEDAQGEAQVETEYEGKSMRGRAVSTDIIEASALAFLQVINRIATRRLAARQRT